MTRTSRRLKSVTAAAIARTPEPASEAGTFAPAMRVIYHDPVDGPILDHPEMRRALSQARRAHRTPGLQLWTGEPGIGKTVTSRALERQCNAEVDAALALGNALSGPNAPYRAVRFTTGGDVDRDSQRQMKRGLYAVYEYVVGPLPARDQRGYSEHMLAVDIVEELRTLNAQIVIVDEAGTKTTAEIRGLALISDVGRDEGWPVSVILVGMDDLAHKAKFLPVLKSRIRLTLVFQPWSPAECREWVLTRSTALRMRVEAGGTAAADAEAAIGHLTGAKGGRLREIDTLLPEVDNRLRKASASKAVRDALDAQTLADAEAAEQADAYVERVRRGRQRAR